MYCSFTNQMLQVPFLLLQHRELNRICLYHSSYKNWLLLPLLLWSSLELLILIIKPLLLLCSLTLFY